MNGPMKMYRMTPIINHEFNVELPKCMYKMKNIHSQRNIADGTEEHVSLPAKKLDIFDQNCQEIPGMAELEAKQHDILEQLAQLKKQIYSLKCDLNIQNDSAPKQFPASIQCSIPIQTAYSLPESIVINANPTSPPYSLEVLQRLLQSQIELTVTSYLHSSVVSLPDSALQLKESLINFKPKPRQPSVPHINIRLIWKNQELSEQLDAGGQVDVIYTDFFKPFHKVHHRILLEKLNQFGFSSVNSNAEFLLSHTPVVGEVNLLRFLSRLTNSELSYETDANSVEIDSILDHCYLLVRAKTKAERTSLLQLFNKSLSKSQWLVGKSRPGIADVAAYSAIKQSLAFNELGVLLGKWYERFQTLVYS